MFFYFFPKAGSQFLAAPAVLAHQLCSPLASLSLCCSLRGIAMAVWSGSGSVPATLVRPSLTSVSSGELQSLRTCNCEMAVLPLRQLLSLQPDSFLLQGDTLAVLSPLDRRPGGGFTVISDGFLQLDGQQQCRLTGYFKR